MRLFTASLVVAGLSATAVTAQDVDLGRALYQTHCANCHGVDADGQGPLAGALIQKPVNLSRLSADNKGEFPLERVVRRIDGRDPLISHGSPMPVYGDYFEGVANAPLKVPTGQPMLVSQPVADLVTYLLSLQQDM